MFDLSIIKMGLEYAQFQDYRVRDAINELIKNVESDMEDVGFDASPVTKKVVEEFESLITDIETERARPPDRIRLDDVEEVSVREIQSDLEESGDARRVVNVDDEVDEFVQTVARANVTPNKKE